MGGGTYRKNLRGFGGYGFSEEWDFEEFELFYGELDNVVFFFGIYLGDFINNLSSFVSFSCGFVFLLYFF